MLFFSSRSIWNAPKWFKCFFEIQLINCPKRAQRCVWCCCDLNFTNQYVKDVCAGHSTAVLRWLSCGSLLPPPIVEKNIFAEIKFRFSDLVLVCLPGKVWYLSVGCFDSDVKDLSGLFFGFLCFKIWSFLAKWFNFPQRRFPLPLLELRRHFALWLPSFWNMFLCWFISFLRKFEILLICLFQASRADVCAGESTAVGRRLFRGGRFHRGFPSRLLHSVIDQQQNSWIF